MLHVPLLIVAQSGCLKLNELHPRQLAAGCSLMTSSRWRSSTAQRQPLGLMIAAAHLTTPSSFSSCLTGVRG